MPRPYINFMNIPGLRFEDPADNRPAPTPVPAPTPAPQPTPPAGSTYDPALVLLLRQQTQDQERIRELEKQKTPDGGVVLTGDDAARWQQLRELGDLDQLKNALQATQELTQLRRTQTLRDAAELCKYDHDVLAGIAGNLEISIQEVEKDGKKEKQAVVKVGDTTTPLAEYAEREWAKLMPSLRPSNTQTRFPGTGATEPSHTSGNAVIDQFLERRSKLAEQKNPLMK